jgi:hypothetical protein
MDSKSDGFDCRDLGELDWNKRGNTTLNYQNQRKIMAKKSNRKKTHGVGPSHGAAAPVLLPLVAGAGRGQSAGTHLGLG